MKKYLYGTTALIAAGAVAGPAVAEDPVKLGVGGWYIFNVGLVSGDDAVGEPAENARDHVFSRWGCLLYTSPSPRDRG